MCLWKSWTPAPWKYSCAVCSRGKATARVSAGSPSILTDVWTVKIKSFSSGLILFTASSWTFLIEQGELSNHVWRWEAMHLCLRSSPSGDMCSSPLMGSNTACLLMQVSVQGLGLAGFARKSWVPSWDTWKEKHVSPLVDFKRKWFYFLKKVLLM